MENLISFDFMSSARKLMKDCFSFKKYKAMNPFLAVLCGIIMIPFVAAFFVVFAVLYVSAFAYKLFGLPVRAIHGLVNKEGQEVKHGTQVIIYLISWPVILFGYLLLVCSLVGIYLSNVLAVFLARIWTLCGVEWNLFPHEEYKETVKEGKIGPALPIILVVISIVLLLGIPFGINYIEYFQYVTNDPFDMVLNYLVCYGLPSYLGFAGLMSLIGFYFVPRVKVKDIDVPVEEQQEEVKAEE